MKLYAFLVAGVCAISGSAFSAVVTFPDPYLEAVVRITTRIGTGDIHESDLVSMDRLEASGYGIRDLTGLEYCTALTTVWLGGNRITSTGPLLANPGLGAGDEISLGGNPLSHAAVCEEIPALQARGVDVQYMCSSDCESTTQAPPCPGTLSGTCPDLNAEATALWSSAFGVDWTTLDSDYNGVPDSWDAALFQAVLCSDTHLFKQAAVCAYESNLETLSHESLGPLQDYLTAYPHISAALLAGSPQSNCLSQNYWGFTGAYYVARVGAGVPFDAYAGDVDLDGVTNRQEALNVMMRNGTREEYVAAALNPLTDGLACSLEECPDLQAEAAAALSYSSDSDGNGIPDTWELLLFETILCSESDPRRQAVVCAYQDNLAVFRAASYQGYFATYERLYVALLALSPSMNVSLRINSHFPGRYQVAEMDGVPVFTASGDLDGDGYTNAQEASHVSSIAGTAEDFVRAVLDPDLNGLECDGELDQPCPEGYIYWESYYWYTLLRQLDWNTADENGDGVADGWQLLAFANVLCDRTAPHHMEAVCVYRQNLATYRREPSRSVYEMFSSSMQNLYVPALSLSTEMRDYYLTVMTSLAYGQPPQGTYVVATAPNAEKLPNEPFAADGDLDGDGVSNRQEYENVLAAGLTLEDYLEAIQHPLLDGSKPLSSLPLSAYVAVLLVGILSVAGVVAIRGPVARGAAAESP